MPAVRFSTSPPPRPPPPPPGTSSPEQAPAQPVRSAFAHPESSLEATFGLIFQSHDRRYNGQDAFPPRSPTLSTQSDLACDVAVLKRRSHPSRPARPTSAALQRTQAYLGATVKPSTMRLKDVEAWVEDSLHAQAMYGMTPQSPLDQPASTLRRWSEKQRSGEWPSFMETCTTQDTKADANTEPQQRLKSSSFSSSLGKRLARSPSDLVNWLKASSAQGSTSRSRSISQGTEPNEEDQTPPDNRWSNSSRRRLLRLSDGSQRAATTPNTPPTYRSVLNGLHRRFHSTNSSDSSWSSFGCIDGMRRPDADMSRTADANANTADESAVPFEGRKYLARSADPKTQINSIKKTAKDSRPTEEGKSEQDSSSSRETNTVEEHSAAKEVNQMKQALKKIASRLEVPIRPTRPYLESDTACMMPY